jgi:hypothetical protein
MGFLDNLKKKGAELAQQAQTLGTEALEKGKVLGAESLTKGQALAEEGLTKATATGENLALKAKFGLALDRLASGDIASVDAKLVDLHIEALKDPAYASQFNAYAQNLKAPKAPTQTHNSGDKIRDALDNGVSAVDVALSEGTARFKAQKALVDLAVK